MLRRRKKPPKVQRHETPGPQPSGRRRARPDAPVPPALKVRPDAGRDVVLVTGFHPFGGEGLNPSWEVCKRLPAKIGELRVETCRIPCEFRRAIEVVAEAIERLQPAMVLCLGQAGGRSHVSVERVAINVDDARIADNSGASPVDEAIAANGPAAYFSTLPIKAMAVAMRGAGVPALVSNSAGTYVCNHLMYGVLHFLAASNTPARAGFIHLPYAEEQVMDKPGIAAMSIATMVKGVEAAIAAASRDAPDIKVSEGTLD
jgi:pyroglutamyl-peptidase